MRRNSGLRDTFHSLEPEALSPDVSVLGATGWAGHEQAAPPQSPPNVLAHYEIWKYCQSTIRVQA